VVNYDRLHRRLLRHLGCPDQAGDCLHDACAAGRHGRLRGHPEPRGLCLPRRLQHRHRPPARQPILAARGRERL
jgi:hypothetical protein